MLRRHRVVHELTPVYAPSLPARSHFFRADSQPKEALVFPKFVTTACSFALLATTTAWAQEPVSGAPVESAASTAAGSAAAPVVTAQEGNWAFLFRFGGLAPLSFRGVNDFAVEPVGAVGAGTSQLFTEFGMRKVLKRFSIPFWVGLAMVNDSTRNGVSTSNTSFGLSGGAGLQYTFRAWRRIAPYVGGFGQLQFIDPTGDANWLLGFALGPVLGVEYYIADRVSLFAQGQFALGVAIADASARVILGPTMSMGGNTGVNVYF